MKHLFASSPILIGVCFLVITGAAVGQVTDSSGTDEVVSDDLLVARAVNCLKPNRLRYALLIQRLCSWGYLRCGSDGADLLDTAMLKPDEYRKGIVDSVQAWVFKYSNGCKSLRFWGDVCHSFNVQYGDSAYLAAAVTMYRKAHKAGCEGVTEVYVTELCYYAEMLSSQWAKDSAFDRYYEGLTVIHSNRDCLKGIVKTAKSITQIDSAIPSVPI